MTAQIVMQLLAKIENQGGMYFMYMSTGSTDFAT